MHGKRLRQPFPSSLTVHKNANQLSSLFQVSVHVSSRFVLIYIFVCQLCLMNIIVTFTISCIILFICMTDHVCVYTLIRTCIGVLQSWIVRFWAFQITHKN